MEKKGVREMNLRDILEEHRGKCARIRLSPHTSASDLDEYLAKYPSQPEYDYGVRVEHKNNQIGIFWRDDGIIPDAIIEIHHSI
jgi:hypothetical protein